MRTLTRTLALVLACSLVLAGCDSLSLKPRDEIASDQVWKDPTLTKSFLNDVYARTGLGYGDPMPTPGVVDEALNTHNHPGSENIMSNLNPSDRGIWDAPGWRPVTNAPYQQYYWPSVYESVRKLNLFITNVKDSKVLPSSSKKTLLGEAYFLRGYFYHNLMKLYGGVPVIKKPFELSGDLSKYQVPRNSFKGTIDFIVADLERAASRLDSEPRRPGAASKGAAMALESRVRLHAASDLYNNSPFSGNKAKFVSYTGGNQQDRWQAALNAAQEVIDMGAYSLKQTDSPHEDHELFTKGNPSGAIWSRFFKESGGYAHNQSTYVSPNGYNSWSGDTPIQQHVNAYEMADGSDFEWEGADPRSASEPVDAKNPYDDRDPRLYANIHFNNADWRTRPPGIQTLDPKGVIQTGWFEDPEQGGSMDSGIQGTLRPGLDTRESGIQNWNGTKTGYNLRKFVDRDINPSQEQAYNQWQYIRYAEVLLNKAEAAANLGKMDMALQALNKVRSRVGMPDVKRSDVSGKEELLAEIRQEREVELAFEGHRYFDVRRWKMGEETYTDARGIRAVGHLVPKSHPQAQELVDNYYNYYYNVVVDQERQWKNKNYFLPISRDEMDKNPKLKQNPGY
ncbi:MAG: RagB/SusD family nutrient uptake outer membrane protein [Salinibacter sp.]